MAKAKRSETINQLHTAARTVRTALAAQLNGHGFHAGQDGIMLALHSQDGQTPGQLAQRLGVRPPTVTKTINRLSAQGILEKRPSVDDQRQANVFLTEGGRDAIANIERAVKRTEKQALKGFDKKDRKTLFKLLARIEDNLAGGDASDDVPERDDEDLPVLATVLEEAAVLEGADERD
jgi:DNA-binding MarR family transcriptional regulator